MTHHDLSTDPLELCPADVADHDVWIPNHSAGMRLLPYELILQKRVLFRFMDQDSRGVATPIGLVVKMDGTDAEATTDILAMDVKRLRMRSLRAGAFGKCCLITPHFTTYFGLTERELKSLDIEIIKRNSL